MTYRDLGLSIEERVADLLAQMTLEEKTAQLGSVFAFDLVDGRGLDAGALAKFLDEGVGQITRLAGATSLTRREVAELANRVQRYLRDHTRLQVPAVLHEECLAGYMATDATVFPQALGLAASWRPELVRRIGGVIGSQMRLGGVHFGLSPVLDIARDPRWGRIEETFGEDTHLTSTLGLAMVEGLQHHGDGTGILATAKHFVGHGVPEGGRNAATPHIPPREMAEVFAPPFEQAVRHGRVASVMHAYHDLDGVPCIANRELLTTLLRDEWGFGGTVVSDYNGIEELHGAHRVAADLERAAAMALAAGLDVELPETSGFGDPLLRAIDAGLVTEADVDRAVTRVLTQKFALGLFEDPYVDPDRVAELDPAGAELAAEAAAGAAVLLQNRGGLLPLRPGPTIALIGPNADASRALVGDYAHVAHQELLALQRDSPGAGLRPIPADLALETELVGVDSIRDAMIAAGVDHEYAPGCDVDTLDRSGFDRAVAVAAGSDLAVLVLGERSGLTPAHTTGESRDRADVALPGVQQELLEAVAATGTPIVLVLLGGRPNAVPWAADHVDAILWAILPGQAGAAAMIDILFGRREPEGRLPVTVPRAVGQIPLHYGHNPSSARSRWWDDYVDESHDPLWPFGHGLGYTTFDVTDAAGPGTIRTDGEELMLTALVTNTGARRGSTVVQVYLEQAAASVVRPAKRLIWFAPVVLDAGESAEVAIRVPIGRLALVDREHRRVVEAGTVGFAIGLSSADIHQRLTVEVDGPDHPVPLPPPAR